MLVNHSNHIYLHILPSIKVSFSSSPSVQFLVTFFRGSFVQGSPDHKTFRWSLELQFNNGTPEVVSSVDVLSNEISTNLVKKDF